MPDIKTELAERQAAERADLAERQAIEREAEGLGPVPPIATWNAFSPRELAEVVAGVTRVDIHHAHAIISGSLVVSGPDGASYEFGTERRDPFTGPTAAGHSGALIGGARWRIERVSIADWKLHLLQAEPCGAA